MNTQLLADYLASEKQFLVFQAESSADAILSIAGSEKPEVVLLSPSLEGNPDLGLQVARQLRTQHPDTHIIMLLDASERSVVVEAFRAGARGIFCRTEPLQTLVKCVECAHGGQVWANSRELEYLLEAVSEAISVHPPGDKSLASLSKREQEVVLCVADGLSNREIAGRLNLTEHTVKNYLFRIFAKLGVSSRVEVVLYVFKLMQASATSPGAKPSAGEAATTPVAGDRATIANRE